MVDSLYFVYTWVPLTPDNPRSTTLTGANETRDITVANTPADKLYFHRTTMEVYNTLSELCVSVLVAEYAMF